ncbi:MAG: WYL domain-containing protein [Bacteroidales bacterium]|nr:WYL domain-containing protein [Candidatus Cryptobacteroides aphodequi]
MDQPKIERVLRLMRLMSGNAYLTVDELAERLDTSYRSIYRYIDSFKEVGFAVEKIHGNIYRIVSMPAQFKDLENLVYFSEEEARIVAGLIENLDQTNALKANLYNKLSAVYDITSIREYVGPKSNASNIQALSGAIAEHRKVVLKNYSSAHSGSIKDRTVEPFDFTNNHMDVWAYDIAHNEPRLFKIPRIEWVDVLFEPWEHEAEHIKTRMDAFRMVLKDPVHVRLEMTLLAKDLLCEEYPLAEADVHKEGDKWVFDSQVGSLKGVGRFVLGLADNIKIVDSPELSEYISSFAKENFK